LLVLVRREKDETDRGEEGSAEKGKVSKPIALQNYFGVRETKKEGGGNNHEKEDKLGGRRATSGSPIIKKVNRGDKKARLQKENRRGRPLAIFHQLVLADDLREKRIGKTARLPGRTSATC